MCINLFYSILILNYFFFLLWKIKDDFLLNYFSSVSFCLINIFLLQSYKCLLCLYEFNNFLAHLMTIFIERLIAFIRTCVIFIKNCIFHNFSHFLSCRNQMKSLIGKPQKQNWYIYQSQLFHFISPSRMKEYDTGNIIS